MNGAAGPTAGDAVKGSMLRPGRLLKVVAQGLGDGPTLDVFQEPTGDVVVCYTLTNGTDVHRFGARWTAGSCSYREIHQLWSDGAAKNRWVYLPECGQIDSSDMDDWSFPVGTRLWKQFDLGGELLETRMIHRYGPGATDFLYAVYEWNAGSTDATLVTTGVEDLKGTEHDIPAITDCQRCHGPYAGGGGVPSRYLGFSTIQLSHAGPGVTMASLSADGLLTVPAPGGFTIPGTPTEQAALGYLHANDRAG